MCMTEINANYMKDAVTNMYNKYKEIADVLGESEDFDGLVSMIEDML